MPPPSSRSILLAGATGLVGCELLARLTDDPRCTRLHVWLRRRFVSWHHEWRYLDPESDRDLFQPIIEFNFPGRQAPRVWRNFEPEDNLVEAVAVDKELHDMGYRPRDPAKYVTEKYGGDWVYEPPKTPPTDPTAGFMGKLKAAVGKKPPVPGQEFAEGSTDPLDLATNRLNADAETAVAALVAPIRKLVAESASFEELQAGIVALYGQMPIDQLGQVMELALTAAEAAGRVEIAEAAKAG